MLCRIYFFILFSISVSALNQYSQKHRSNQRRHHDILKNITRVNNVLEELIDNYAKLKSLYQSQESLSEYSSDMEIDQVYKMKRQRAELSSPKTTTRHPTHIATEMFLSEEDPHEGGSDEASDNSRQSNQKEHPKEEFERETTVKTQFNKVMEKERETNVQHLVKYQKQLSAEDDTNNKLKSVKHFAGSVSKKEMAKNKLTIHKPGSGNSKKDNSDTSETTKENDSAAGSGRSSSTLKAVDTKDSNESEERVIKPNMIKITMNTKSKSLSNNQIKAPARNANNGSIQYRTVKQVIKAEEFSGNNIWNEVIHKPVNLNTEIEVVYKQPKLYFRSQKGNMVKPGLESLEDEKEIKKEQFKTRILRKAYGDACLKVVVKKCYKACKEASKITCRKYQCKAEFKMKFLNHAKTGCIKEFSEVAPSSRSAVHQEDQGFHDVTRNGYLAAACLPAPQPAQITRRLANVSLLALAPDIQLNILRDRFERACQEVSTEKCTAACHYALKQTCSNVECRGGKKTAFDKACKKQCKLSYKSSSASSHDHSDTSSSENSSTKSDSSSSGSSDVSSNKNKTDKKKKIKLKKIDKKKDKKKKSEKEQKKEKKKVEEKEKKKEKKKAEEKEKTEEEEKEDEKEENDDKKKKQEKEKEDDEEEEEEEKKKEKANKKKNKKRV